jgi:hypothetical protein
LRKIIYILIIAFCSVNVVFAGSKANLECY